jgi:hypothetical protein
MSLVAVNDTESQWESHFRDMAEGKLANMDYYVVSVNQIGKGDGKLPKATDDKMLGPTHDPTTGRLLDPISVAANQTKEEIKSMKPQFNIGIKTAQKVSPAPQKKKKKDTEEKKEDHDKDTSTSPAKRKKVEERKNKLVKRLHMLDLTF